MWRRPEDAVPTVSADFVGGGVAVQTHGGFKDY